MVAMAALLVVILIIFSPLLAIWAINTLFSLGIPYDMQTWTASLILIMLFGSGSKSASRKD